MKCINTDSNRDIEFGKLDIGDTFTCEDYDSFDDVFMKVYTPNEAGTIGIRLNDGRWTKFKDEKIVHKVEGVFTYHTYTGEDGSVLVD